jgi:hypothetical protein
MKKILFFIIFSGFIFSGILLVGQTLLQDKKIENKKSDIKPFAIEPNFNEGITLKTEGKQLVDKCFSDVSACSRDIDLLNRINLSIENEKSHFKKHNKFIRSDFTILYEIIDKDGLIEVGSPSLYYALLQWRGAWNRPVYGCFCGYENQKDKFSRCPIDYSDLDSACEAHDDCYLNIKNTKEPQWMNCDPDFVRRIDVIRMKQQSTGNIYKSEDDFKQMQNIALWARDLFKIKAALHLSIK